uniref:Uncharacterized protein n=1 Tax=Sphenodon punctatus TaxID=8508 RepID=A0A8D0H3K9_SPHPU
FVTNSYEKECAPPHSNCRHNAPLWSTLHLDQLIPLDETLNISKYTGDVSAALDKLNVNVSAVTLLSDKQRDLLRDLGAGGLQNLDFSGVLEQIGKNPIKQDLQVLVRKLEDLANKTQNESRRTELRNEVSDLKHIQDQVDTRFLPEIKALNRSLQLLRVVVPRISVSSIGGEGMIFRGDRKGRCRGL